MSKKNIIKVIETPLGGEPVLKDVDGRQVISIPIEKSIATHWLDEEGNEHIDMHIVLPTTSVGSKSSLKTGE